MEPNTNRGIVRLSEEDAGLLGLPLEWVGDAHAEISFLDKGESLKPATMTISLAASENTVSSVKDALVRKALTGEKRLRRGVYLLVPEADQEATSRLERLGLRPAEVLHKLGEKALGHAVFASDVGRLRAALADL